MAVARIIPAPINLFMFIYHPLPEFIYKAFKQNQGTASSPQVSTWTTGKFILLFPVFRFTPYRLAFTCLP